MIVLNIVLFCYTCNIIAKFKSMYTMLHAATTFAIITG